MNFVTFLPAVGRPEVGENGGRFKGNGTNGGNSFARVITHESEEIFLKQVGNAS